LHSLNFKPKITINFFASNVCQINSRTQQPLKSDDVTDSVTPTGGNPGVADHWFTAASHRFCNVETRLFATTATTNNAAVTPTLTPILPTKTDARCRFEESSVSAEKFSDKFNS
jgi:hypothetical protein